jgi:hypothetical protein
MSYFTEVELQEIVIADRGDGYEETMPTDEMWWDFLA